MTRSLILIWLAACGASTKPAPVAIAKSAAPPTAASIIADMIRTYRGARVYSDHGYVKAYAANRSFDTIYVRGKRFRFDLRDDNAPEKGLVVWSDGPHTYNRWYGPAHTTEAADLTLAVTLATKPSYEVAYTVPRLLDAVTTGMLPTELANLAIDGEEAIDDHPCWRLRGTRDVDGETIAMRLWIDRASHVLRRTARGDDESATVTTYSPTLEGVIEVARLEPPDFSEDYAPDSDWNKRMRPMINAKAPAFPELAAHAGHVVVLDFWATWCGPCRKTIPRLEAWHAKFASRGLVVIGLSSEDKETVEPFAVEHDIRYELVHDEDSAIGRQYNAMMLPTLILIDKAGVVRYVNLGAGDLDTVETILEGLL